MSRQNDSPLSSVYLDLDSQRLKDTFFSTPGKSSPKKSLFFWAITALTIVIFSVGVFAFVSKYEFLITPRTDIEWEKNSTSLLHSQTPSVSFLGKNKLLMKKKGSSVYLKIVSGKKIGVQIDLKNPINLTSHFLFLYLKMENHPLGIDAVAKDVRFFSNSLNPLTIEVVGGKKAGYIKIPIVFKNTSLGNTNLSRINQIRLFFYPKDEKTISNTKGWILIKDLALVKNVD